VRARAAILRDWQNLGFSCVGGAERGVKIQNTRAVRSHAMRAVTTDKYSPNAYAGSMG
jgi:hypothetical protein